ncbi:MAG TPA: hypothetical protein P5531_08955 [Bacteroidales bacterium]|nr:hypothetical protein [Bacteroidales bacterium]HSA43782.1 hypothetical protein [Bacteroidales bacterium]
MKTLILTGLTVIFLCLTVVTGARAVQSNPPDSLEMLEKMVAGLSVEKAENIPVGYIQLDLIREQLNRLAGNIKPDEATGDSERNRRLKRLQQTFDSISPLIIAGMARIELALYEDGLAYFREHDSAAAARQFEMSLNYNNAFAPSAYSLISLYNTPEKAEKAAALYEQYAKTAGVQENEYYRNLFRILASQVLDSLLRQAGKLGDTDLPYDAVQLVAFADSFAQRHRIGGADAKIRASYTAVHRAMYESYLRIADKALQNRKQELAASYYSRAGEYLRTHAALAGTDTRWEAGLAAASKPPPPDPVAKVRKKKGRQRPGKVKGKTAAGKIKTTKPALLPPPDTMMSYYLGQSALASEAGQYADAIRHCDAAASYHDTVAAMPDARICSCYRRAAVRPMLDTIRSAYFTVWKNQLQEAGKVLENAKARLQPWCLQNDSEINKALASLEQRIREKDCDNVQAAYESEVYRAIALCMTGNYLSGNDHLEKAARLLSGHASCIRSDSLLRLTEQKYRPYIAWQQEWTNARQSLERKNHREFLGHYLKAWDITEANKLSDKLRFSPPADFVKERGDTALLAAYILLLSEQGQTDACWELIRFAADRKYLSSLPSGVLAATGRLMAATDGQTGDTIWLDRLKKGGRQFSVIKKAYLSRAKQPSHEP